MNSLSHAELVLLALLGDAPAHAYELVERTEAMRLDQWARVPSSTLYNVLRRMETHGWVTGEKEPGERGRPRIVYQRTPDGSERLFELLRQGLRDPAPIYSDVLLAGVFAAGTAMSPALDAGLQRLAHRRERLVEARQASDLSTRGRAVLDFYLGIVDLESDLLRSLRDAEVALPRRSEP